MVYCCANNTGLFSLNEADIRTGLKTDLHLTDDSKLDILIAAYHLAISRLSLCTVR